MDYALLTPEFNSGRIYTGPGSASFVEAALSWDGLAVELESAADGYRSVVSALTTVHWWGPASASMAATAMSFVDWLDSTAQQVQQTADQARAAAAAFDQVHATVVPPALIAANRALLKMLIATNWLGQNAPAIADTEAAYADMWAQDTAAMYEYAGASAAATAGLTAFSAPSPTSSTDGLVVQASTVAAADSGATDSIWSHLLEALESLAQQVIDGFENPAWLNILSPVSNIANNELSIFSTATSLLAPLFQRGLVAASDVAELVPLNSLNAMAGGLQTPSLGAPVLASVGRAGEIGPLSVPASWAAPTSKPVHPLSGGGFTTLSSGEPAQHGMPGVPGVPIGANRGANGVVPRYGARLTVMPRSPAAG